MKGVNGKRNDEMLEKKERRNRLALAARRRRRRRRKREFVCYSFSYICIYFSVADCAEARSDYTWLERIVNGLLNRRMMRQQRQQIRKTLRHPIRDLPFYICTQKREKYFHPFLCTVYRWMAKEKEGVGRNRRFWLGTNSGGSKRSLYDCGIVKGSREPVLVLVVRRLWSDAPFHPDDWWSHPAIHKRISLSLTIALVEWIAPSSSFPLDWFPVFGHLVSLAHPPRTYIHTYIYISFILFRWMIDQCRRQIMLRQKEIGERNRQVGQQGALARSLSCTWYVFFNFDQNRIKNGMKWFRQSG